MKRCWPIALLLATVACTSTTDDSQVRTITSSVVAASGETLAVVPPMAATSSVPIGSSSTISSSPILLPQSSSTVAPSSIDPLPRADLFDAAFALEVLAAGSLDVSVAVISDGRIVHTFAASSPKSSRPVDSTTRFRIASISKVVTAEAVMKLVDQGVLHLDDRVVGTVADNMGISLTDERFRAITIRQLLSHTSGISNFLKIFFDAGTYDQASMLSEILGQTLATDPGSTYKYSNVNYVLLGKAIEMATGLPYSAAVHQLILDPLGLDSFRMVGTYEFSDGDALHPVSGNRTYMEQLGPAGAWVATATDVAKLLLAIDDSSSLSILTPESMKSMKTPATPLGAAPNWDYGFGLRLFASGEWGHSGSVENVHAMVVKRPDGLIVSALVNGSKPKDTDELIRIINDAVLAARTGIAATTSIGP